MSDYSKLREIVERLEAMHDREAERLGKQFVDGLPFDEIIDAHTGAPAALPYLTALATAYSALIP